jgi:hypothetical protein
MSGAYKDRISGATLIGQRVQADYSEDEASAPINEDLYRDED